MSKKNKRRFFQSQRAHLKAMFMSDELLDIKLRVYHLEVYCSQSRFGRILSKQERLNIFYREVLPF